MLKYGVKWLRIVLSFVLAVGVLALLLGLLAGPTWIVHALSEAVVTLAPQEAPGDDVQQAPVDPIPPELAALDVPRPPLALDLSFNLAPQVLHVCAVGCPYTTVQGAVDAARSGDLILVAEGTYNDHDSDGYVVEIAKTVTLRGGYTSSDWTASDINAHPTYLDGQNAARVILVSGDVAPTIEGFVIRNGQTEVGGDGGGIYVASGDPTISRCRIEDNTASFSGGGFYVASGTPLIENCLIVGNSADQKRGGGGYIAAGFATVRYSVLYENTAAQQGGGLYVAGGVATVRGVIFSFNTAGDGGGTYAAGGTLLFSYNGYWENSPDHVSGSLSTGGDDIVDVDPLFVDPGAGDFHLGLGSTYVDAGDPGSYPAVDYDGAGRYFGSGPDMGAYESYAGTCFVRVGEDPIYGSVNAALAVAAPGDVVKIAGLCTGTGASVVTVTQKVTLRGGYTLTNWTDPDPDLYPSVIDGQGARRGIYVGSVDAVIEGLQIQNGGAVRDGGGIYVAGGTAVTVRNNEIMSNTLTPPTGVGGGGVYVSNGNGVVIQNNEIHDNQITVSAGDNGNGGAGIFVLGGAALIEDNEIYENTTHGFGGGGIYVQGGTLTIRRNHIYGNIQMDGNNGGGGIYIFQGTATIEQNNIHSNQTASTYAWSGGGGIYIHNGDSIIRSNLIYDNNVTGSRQGGGLFVYSAVPQVNGNTFYANNANEGGAAFLNGTATVITNSIIASNTAGTTSGVSGDCDYCVIFNNTNSGSSTHSLFDDPEFVDAEAGDFHLQPSSVARDTGGTPYAPEDYDGYARPFGAGSDIGAFEYYEGACFARLGVGTVYDTVQAAIDAAGTGDPVLVAGQCTASGGPLATINKELILQGGYTLTNWMTPSTQTILDGGGAQQVIVINTTDPVVVDGFIVRNGRATAAGASAGLHVLNTGNVVVRNVAFHDNTATSGPVLGVGGGAAYLYNNTFVYNAATSVIDVSAATTALVSNTIVVSNTASTLVSGATCEWCFTSGDPMFVDPAARDFHLQPASPCIFAADPNTALDHDWEGDPRPLGSGFDIGADQCALYPGFEFAPSGLVSLLGAPGQPTVHTHYLTNTGGISDTYELTHSIVYSGGTGWAVTYDRFLSLDGAETAPVPVAVQVPVDAISGSVATVYVTATSSVNPLLSRSVTNTTYINWNPGVTVTPVFSEFLNPGDTITYVHTLRNLGNAPDSFTVTVSSQPGGWATITPTTILNLGPGASASIWMSVTIPGTMPGGVTETVRIGVVNWGLDTWAVITDELEVNHVTGNRFVDATSGNDYLNNCLVLGSPCRSVGYATVQAAAGDTVRMAAGTYYEYDLLLNEAIILSGGWSKNSQDPAYWGRTVGLRPDPQRLPTIIDAQGLGRVFEILGDPTVEGLTLRGGTTIGSGGAVFIASGSPVLRNNRILNSQAQYYGGGVYNWMGTPTIERCWIGYNTATWGAGFATGGGAPRFWNNVVFKNTAPGTEGNGGGIYVADGTPRIWHDTLYGNSAARGGGIYVNAGSAAISNTIVVSNTASNTGGGMYNVPSGTVLAYNDVWGNINGNYVGVTAGPHSVAVYPGFISISGDDYHLVPDSPVGDIAAASPISDDLDGEARVVGSGPDIGADEFAWGEIRFTPAYSGVVNSCDTISYTHVVSHSGRFTNTIVFDWTSDQGVGVTIDPSQVTLGHGVTAPITVEVTPWCPSIGPVKDTTLITASFSAYSFISDTVTDTTYIDVDPGLQFLPNRTTFTVPGTIYLTHTLTNLGYYTDVITYTISEEPEWGAGVLQPRIVIGPRQSRVVTVALTIPDNAVSGTVHVMQITANSIYSWMVNSWPISATVVDTTTIGPKPVVDVRKAALWQGLCIDPNSIWHYGWYPYTVWNLGNLTDTIDLSAYMQLDYGFPITLFNSEMDEVILPELFTPTVAHEYGILVEVPVGTPYGIMSEVYLSATSQFDPGATDAESYHLTVIQMDLGIDGPVTQTFFLEPEISYQHEFTYSETFTDAETNEVYATLCEEEILPLNWTFSTSPNMVPIAEGDVGEITITVGIPMSVYTVTGRTLCVELHTSDTCHTIAWVDDTFIVDRPHVILEPDRYEEDAIPGTVMTYTFTLSNPSSFDDTYALTWLFTRPITRSDWTVFITPATNLFLHSMEEMTLTAIMTVPAGVQMGEEATLVMTATSSYTTAIFDTAVTRWGVPSIPMAQIEPDNVGATYPGTWISYTHVLTNVGNRSGTFTLTTQSSLGAATVEPHVVELAPMESYSPVVVWVYIPTWAEIGSVDDTQVIVNIDKEEEETTQYQVVAHNLTTVLPVPGTRYVNSNGGTDEGNNCLDPTHFKACATIQHAIAQAAPGDEILIAGGIYSDLHTFMDGAVPVTQVVYLDKSVTLRGGYDEDWDVSDPASNHSILNAQGGGRIMYVVAGVTPTISGLYLTYGYVDGENGAGLYIASGAVPIVERNVFEWNEAAGIGAQGGGLYYEGPGGLILRQNTLRNNTAEDGSGAYLNGMDAVVWNNVFDSNIARGLGGGLYLSGGSPQVWNNTFYGNSGARGGGLYYLGSGSPSISNTILAWNVASDLNGGGGVYAAGGTPVLDYNDYWNNAGGDAPGLVTGANSLTVDPGFADSGAGDLHLMADSLLIDQADPQTLVGWDRDGKPRPLLGGYDIGAYEYGLVFAKSGPSYIQPGETIQYTIVITNLAPITQYNVLVTDTLHPALELVGPLVPPTGEYLPAGRIVSWTIDVPGNDIVQLSFTAQVTTDLDIGDQFSNTAWVDGWTSSPITSEYRTCWVRLNYEPTDYTTVQAAVDASTSSSDIVKVAGTCVDVNTLEGLSQVVYLSKTLTIRGGYTRDDWDTADPAANPTTLDALGLGRVLYIAGDVQPSIEGLILARGNAAGLGGLPGYNAGGSVYIVTATVGMAQSIVSGGQADLGGGLCLVNGALNMVNSVVADNEATSGGGGGLYVAAGRADVLHTTFARNAGSGVFLTNQGAVTSTAVFTNVIMADQGIDVEVTLSNHAAIDGVLWWPATGDTVTGGGTWTINNDHTGDPSFAGDGYHLNADSAALDLGIDTGLSIDIDGDPRPWNVLPDLGADELALSMEVLKVVSADPVQTGGSFEYTIYVTNTGGVALGLTITDVLPAQVEPVGPLVWSGIDLGPGATWVQVVPVTAAAGYSGTLTNQVDVLAVEGLAATYILTSHVVGMPGIDVIKTVTPTVAQAGDVVTYTIYVTNTGNLDLLPTVVDTLPAQVSPNGDVTWILPQLAPGGTWSTTLTATIRFGYAGTLANVVRVTTPEGAADTYTALSTVGVTPGVTVTKSANPSPVLAGDPLTYTIYVTNTGNVTLTVDIADVLPADVTLPSTLTWNDVVLGQANPTWSATVVVTPNVGYAGTLTNVVTVDPDQGATAVYTLTTESLVVPLVEISKVADPDPVAAGELLTYTIYVTNTGNVALTAAITDHLPAHTTHVTATDVLTWADVSLDPDEVWTASITVRADWGYAGSLINWIEVDTVQGAYDAYTMTVQALTTLGVEVSKVANPSPVLAGDPLTYTIYVTNTGNVTLTATVTDWMPDHAAPGGSEVWNVILNEANQIWTATLVVTPELTFAGLLTNVVAVDTVEGVSDIYTLTTESLVMAAVTVTKVAMPDPVPAGSTLTYTIRVENSGNITYSATVTDYLPAHTTHPTATTSLTWSIPELGIHEVWQEQVVLAVEWGYSGTLSNMVEVTTNQEVSATWLTTSRAVVTPSLAGLKVVTPMVAPAGEVLTYTIYLTNTGNVTLTTSITDLIPAHTSHVTGADMLTWNHEFGMDDTWSQWFTVTIDAGFPGTVTNQVEVVAVEGATWVYTASALSLAPAVSITKQSDPSIVQAGETLTYTITVTNWGTMLLTGVMVTDTLPAQVSTAEPTTWSVPPLNPGQVWSIDLLVDVAWGYSGTLVNQVDVSTDQGVADTWVDTAYAEVTPALAVTKVANAPEFMAGGVVTYTISVTNTGNVTLTVTITDYLPAHATHVTATGEIVWTAELAGPGATWSQEITVTGEAGYAGLLENVIQVVAAEGVSQTVTETVTSLAPYLEVTKAADPPVVQAGDALTYTITVTNTGTMVLHMTVTDTLPAQVQPNGSLVWTPDPLAPGGVWTITVPVTVQLGYSGTLTNLVEVSSLEGAADSYELISLSAVTPAVTVTKQADPFWAEPGSELVYTICVTNTGNVTLTAWITDWLPAQVTPSGEQNWALEIPPRQPYVITVPVTSMSGYVGPLANVVRVDTAEGVWAVYTETSQSCTPLATLDLAGPAAGAPGTNIVFTATLTPPTTTMPVTYTWEAEGQTTVVHVGSTAADSVTFNWPVDGTYVITLTVINGCGSTLQRTHVVGIGVCPFGVTGVTISGPTAGAVNIQYTLSALVDPANATPPVTYTWSPAPISGQGTANAVYSWSAVGTYNVTVNASNCGGSASDVHSIVISPPCVGVTGVTIAGRNSGYTETLYTFTANLSPANASTTGLTYVWSPAPLSGQGTATATYRWSVLGAQTISVQVTNCGGTASDDHVITIRELSPIYLPLVMRDHQYLPDLEVVSIQTIVGATADEVRVTIRNNGPAPVVTDFWVDLYLDPSRVPTTGDMWNDLCSQGKAWLVRSPSLQPGDTMVLSTNDPDDPDNPDTRYSIWPAKLPTGAHWLYAQADSYWRPVGLIQELNETNNVLGQIYSSAASGGATLPPPPELPPESTPGPVLPPEPRPTPEVRPTPTPMP